MSASGWLRAVALTIAAGALLLAWVPAAMAQPSPPELPDLTPVTVDPATSAFLLLDLTSVICDPRPACVASLPAVSRLLARARTAGVFVGYSTTGGGEIRSEIAPHDGDPVVMSRADKFFNSNLDLILKDHAAQTLVVVGSAANGAVLYTTFGAVERGYTVVVAADGISSGPDFDTYLAEYQLLNMPGFSNPTNDPLKPTSATLSRTDLISFGSSNK